MPQLATPLPARSPELVLRPLGDRGPYVVKDPRTGAYFHLGEQEYFLLLGLDGQQSAEAVCRAFEQRFGEPLPEEDLRGFVGLAQEQGFLQPLGVPAAAAVQEAVD